MKNIRIALLILIIFFAGCKNEPSPWKNSLILAKKTSCKTCKIDIK